MATRRHQAIPRAGTGRTIGLSICAALLYAGLVQAGNFAQDYQKAAALSREGKHAEAEKSFLELEARRAGHKSIRQRLKDEAYGGGASCAARRKEYGRAMELAGKISNGPLRKFRQMEILRAQRKGREILELLRNENLASWPDRLIYRAALRRGQAYARSGDFKSAERDYLLARKATMDVNESASVLVLLGNLYRDDLKDKEKALACFAEVIKLPAKARIRSAGALGYGRLMAERGEGAKALATLKQCKVPGKLVAQVRKVIGSIEEPAAR